MWRVLGLVLVLAGCDGIVAPTIGSGPAPTYYTAPPPGLLHPPPVTCFGNRHVIRCH